MSAKKGVSAGDAKRAAARQPRRRKTVPAVVRKVSATALLKRTAAHARVRRAAAARKHRVQAHARAAAPGPVAALRTAVADAGVMPSDRTGLPSSVASASVIMNAGLQSAEPLDALFRQAAAGDSNAMEHAARALYPVLQRYCRSRLHTSSADVEDVVQTVLLELCERVWEYDPRRSALSWALTITRWQCLSVQTRARRQQGRQPLEATEAVMGTPATERVDETEVEEAFQRAARQLSDTDRALLVRMLEEDTQVEVSDAAARKRRSRLLSRLRAAWRNVHEGV